MLDDLGETFRQIDVSQEPDQPVEQQFLHRGVKFELQHAGHAVVELVDLAVERGHAVAVAHRREGERDVGRGRAGLVGDPDHERRPAAVDDRVGELRRDDLAPQPMLRDRIGKPFRHRVREIARQFARQVGVVRHPRGDEMMVERQLGIGQQHRELGACQRLRAAATLGNLHVVGQVFHRAVELARGFERLHQPLLEAEVFEPAPLRQRDRERLQIVVA